jgi:glyoxylase-like metal-dependent hydrolase (beta-lactamase superfamily II)
MPRNSNRIILLAAATALALVPLAAPAQTVQLPPEAQWPQVTPARGGVAGEETDKAYKLTDSISVAVVGMQNIVVSVGDDGLMISDDQDVPLVPRVIKQLVKISDKPVRYVVNSHWHYDHVGGNDIFGRMGALTIAQENTRRRMMSGVFNPVSNRRQGVFPASYLPKLTFADQMTLHINGDDIVLTHMPAAHTDADVTIYFRKADVIALNDMFFVGENYPGIEVESGASSKGMIAAFDKVLAMIDDKTKVIPARGPIVGKKDVAEFRDAVVAIRGRVAQMVKDGKSEADIVAAHPTKDFDPKWNKDQRRADNFVKAIYYELTHTH